MVSQNLVNHQDTSSSLCELVPIDISHVMGKLFKIDLVEVDDLFHGYHEKKVYQDFRRCCKTKLEQLTKYEVELNCKYFENNDKESINNETNKDTSATQTILTDELNNQLNYYYERNQYALKVLNNTTHTTQSTISNGTSHNHDIKTENDDQSEHKSKESSDDLARNSEMIELLNEIESNFNYNDYKQVLHDIAYNDNTRNYKIFKRRFEEKHRDKRPSDIYCCIRCGMHLTAKSLVMDENFHGRTGPSFLIQSVFNVDIGPKATRKLHTGMHVVSDVFCRRCATNVGWYYHEASKLEQQYKISHYVLECSLITTYEQYMMTHYYHPNCVMPNLDFNRPHRTHTKSRKKRRKKHKMEEEVEDDSDDDDEEDEEDEEEDEEDEDESDDGEDHDDDSSDDTMNDLTTNRMNQRQKRYNERRPLPPYMSADHPSFGGGYYANDGRRNRRKRKRKNSKERENKENEEEEEKQKEKYRKMEKRKRKRKRMWSVPDLSLLQRITTRRNDEISIRSTHSDPQRRDSIKSDYSSPNDSSKTYDDEDDEEEEEEEILRPYNRRRGVRFADMDDDDDDEEEEEDDEDEEQQSI
eukprot:172825_1